MNEAKVTRSVIKFLKADNWEIISYDLPQMGTGTLLQNEGVIKKNEGTIIPDVFAYKNGKVLLCESKSYFSKNDVEKLLELKKGEFNKSISKQLVSRNFNELILTISFPKIKFSDKHNFRDLDVVFLVEKNNCEPLFLNN